MRCHQKETFRKEEETYVPLLGSTEIWRAVPLGRRSHLTRYVFVLRKWIYPACLLEKRSDHPMGNGGVTARTDSRNCPCLLLDDLILSQLYNFLSTLRIYTYVLFGSLPRRNKVLLSDSLLNVLSLRDKLHLYYLSIALLCLPLRSACLNSLVCV